MAGWVLLAAIAGAAVGALVGGAMCADMAAVMRVWVVIKVDAQIQGNQFVANRAGSHLTCNALFSETINYVPNVKSEFHAYCIFAGNIITTGLEGFMYVYAFRGAGLLFKAPMTFVRNFGVNYLASLTMKGVAMRSVFGAYGAWYSYSMSPVEGGDSEQMTEAALDGAFFIERAVYRLATAKHYDSETGMNWEGLGKDVTLLLMMGGLPGRGSSDAQRGDVAAMSRQVISEWSHPVQTAKAEVGKMIETARQFREQIRKFVNGKGAHEKAPDWRTHESNVTEQLRQQYSEANVAEQVTLRIKGTDAQGNPIDVKIRVDNLVRLRDGSYKIVDAKFSDVNNLADLNYNIRNTFTENQKPAYDAVGGNGQGSVTSIEVRGNNGRDIGLRSGQKIPVETGVDIHYDSPNGSGTRGYP